MTHPLYFLAFTQSHYDDITPNPFHCNDLIVGDIILQPQR